MIAGAQQSVVTYHNDNARTGQYLSEKLLSPDSLNAGLFGKRHFLPTDGGVFAQPLYLSRVKIPGKGFHNVLFVASSHDTLYAFDADDESGAGPLWQVSFIDAGKGVTTVSQSDVGCTVIDELGISGTPVIDPAAGTIYLVAFTKEPGGQFVHRLHALDVATGAERPGSPVIIDPAGFVPEEHKQRTGLLLSNGIVYSTWSGHCDLGTYHGWLMAHDAKTLELLGVFNTTPNDSGASFWNGGAGPAADRNGNIFVVSANGDFDGDLTAARYDESVLKVAPSGAFLPVDQFTPFNKVSLDAADLDVGSSGVVLLPDEAGSKAHPHVLFTSGKEGRMYLLDRDALGGAQSGSDTRALASVPIAGFHATFGSAAYFNGAMYVAPENSPMYAFPVAGASLSSDTSIQTLNMNGTHGGIPSISANGSAGGVVWLSTLDDGGRLLAYDATDLSELYDSNLVPSDRLGAPLEFSVPTIADGKVFVPAGAGVGVYGKLAATAPAITAVTNAASYSKDAISPGSLITIFGAGLSLANLAGIADPLPLSIADTSVTVNGIVAPVLFVSPGQINAQVPWEVVAGSATVVVRAQGSASAKFNITVHAAAPGLFTNLQGEAAAINADGSVNSAQHPAPAGSFVSVFFTGQGPVAKPVDDGATPPAGQIVASTMKASATIGGAAAEVQFAGLSPLFPGVAQLNVKVPTLSSGNHPLILTIGGKASNSAQLVVSGH